jgi:polyvinyl alcohol dehydrogenase (cytochrome)
VYFWEGMMKRTSKAVCGLAVGVLLISMPVVQAQDWPMGGQNLNNGRNQPVTSISPSNVGNLHPKWVFPTQGDVSANPAVANGIVYFPDWGGNFYALNANTGQVIWSNPISVWTGIPGDFARNDPAVYNGMVILGNQAGNLANWNGSKYLNNNGASVVAVDANTGNLKWITKVEAFPAAMVTSSPVIHNGIVYVGVASAEENTATDPSYPCCVSRGSVVALDASNGNILWKTYTLPDNHGQTGGYSGGAVWGSTPVVDSKRNALYVGTGNNYSVPVADELCAQNSKNGGANCDISGDHFDSVLALDLTTGAIKWSTRGWPFDPWNVSCIFGFSPGTGNCPGPVAGPDFDFGGSGPNLFTKNSNNGNDDLVGIGQKSGLYWALNPQNGNVAWKTQVGPGSSLGGIEWGTAADGQRIYVAISNLFGIPYNLEPSGTPVNGGSWAALDPQKGTILWQTATPGSCTQSIPGFSQGCMALGPVSVANGVVFAGSMNIDPSKPTMFALDASNGKIIWSFNPGSSVISAPAIVGNMVFWGAGYGHFGPGLGTSNKKFFAFSIN